jgi:hypothetical protein
LILTSNRVGIFDEAFKSRIQLALHYPSLKLEQRLMIWGNFITRLEDLGEDMDVNNIRETLKTLAAFKMNGREIRNAITTARQLARFREEALTGGHLCDVVKISKKFDKYINDGEVDEDVAGNQGIR